MTEQQTLRGSPLTRNTQHLLGEAGTHCSVASLQVRGLLGLATVGSIYGVWLGELLVHGWDVARGAGRRWPVDRDEAAMIVEGAAHVSRHFVDRERAAGVRATYELNLRGGPAITFRFDDGVLDVVTGRSTDADTRISAGARAVMFVLYKRKSQWGQIALGRMLAYGRKPWLAFRFTDLFGGF